MCLNNYSDQHEVMATHLTNDMFSGNAWFQPTHHSALLFFIATLTPHTQQTHTPIRIVVTCGTTDSKARLYSIYF